MMMTSLLIENSTAAPISTLGVHPLREIIQSVEPAAVLYRPWLLQNIIALDRGNGRAPFSVSHQEIHVISRDRLLSISAGQKWSLPDGLPEAQTLILLARPESD